jgi:nucleoid-associated protein YgaU
VKLATFAACVLGASALVIVGCSNDKKPAAANGAPLDVQPVATATPPQTYTPPPAPGYGSAVEPTRTVTFDPAPAGKTGTAAAATAGGTTYTVKKGDTLSKIAREHYGDTKAYARIVAANPGINANSIKVGQQIVLP